MRRIASPERKRKFSYTSFPPAHFDHDDEDIRAATQKRLDEAGTSVFETDTNAMVCVCQKRSTITHSKTDREEAEKAGRIDRLIKSNALEILGSDWGPYRIRVIDESRSCDKNRKTREKKSGLIQKCLVGGGASRRESGGSLQHSGGSIASGSTIPEDDQPQDRLRISSRLVLAESEPFARSILASESLLQVVTLGLPLLKERRINLPITADAIPHVEEVCTACGRLLPEGLQIVPGSKRQGATERELVQLRSNLSKAELEAALSEARNADIY